MKILDKIDGILGKMDEKNIMDLDGLDLETETKERLLEARKIGGKEYDTFFKGMLKKWKIKSYKDLPKDKQKKFFDEVDSKWEAKGQETD